MMRRKVEMEEEHRSKRCRFDHHSLPDDLIREILLRLPAKSVGRLRCATKSWLSITTAPSFVHAHSLLSPKSFLAKSLQPCSNVNCRHYRTVQLVSSGQAYTSTTHDVRISGQPLASCNGLLFLGHRITTGYFVLNPLTGFLIDLPNPPVPFQCDRTCSGFGFYFHRWSGEYRVLNVYHVQWGGIKAVVHSLGGGDSWRQIQATEPMVRILKNSQSSVLVNDCLHWFCQDASDHGLLLILIFDVREETFRLMKPPPYCGRCCMFCVKKAVTKDLGMVDMEGKLGCWIAKGDVMRIELWVAGDDAEGEVDGWRKMYSLCCDGDCREIWLSGYDVRSAVYIRGEVWLIFGGKLVQWDLKEGKCCAMWDLCERFDHLCPPAMIYRETLISPVFFFFQVALTMPALPSFS